MTIHFFRIFFYALCTLFTITLQAEVSLPLSGEEDSNSQFAGFIDIRNGNMSIEEIDISTGGIVPIELRRYYIPRDERKSILGQGHYFNLPLHLREHSQSKTNASISFELEEGFDKQFNGSFIQQDLKMLISNTKNQYSPIRAGEVGGVNNFHNIKMSYDLSEKTWTVILPYGEKRIYSPTASLGKYELSEIRLSNGFRRFYEYDENKNLSRIFTTTPDKSIQVNELNFSYGNENYFLSVEANSGLKTDYQMEKKTKDENGQDNQKNELQFLKTVIPTLQSPLIYSEMNKFVNSSQTLQKGNNRNIYISSKCNEKMNVLMPVGINGENKKVYEIAPLYGSNNISERLGAYKGDTDIKNIYGDNVNYTFTIYNIESSTRSIKNEQKDKILSVNKLHEHFQNGSIDYQTVQKDQYHVYHGRWYEYDKAFNVTKEIIRGNLSGNGIETFHACKPDTKGVETYTIYRKYSEDGLNLLISESADYGPEKKWEYLSGTNLPTKEFTIDQGKIVERKFYEYNKHNFLVCCIEDDGSSENQFCLDDVTYRLITRNTINLDKSINGVGLPIRVSRSYWDPSEHCEIPLRTHEYSYTLSGKITEERVFDSNGRYCYSKNWEFDERNRLIEESNSLGEAIRYEYDNQNNKILEENYATGIVRRVVYDFMNRPVTITDQHPDGSELSRNFVYDYVGRCIEETDPYGNVTKHKFEGFEREIETELPPLLQKDGSFLSQKITREYDNLDRIIAETDANGHRFETKYTAFGKPYFIKNSDGTEKRIVYREDGEILAKYNESGAYQTFEYDYAKRVTKTSYFTPSGELIKEEHNTYKGACLTSATDGEGHITQYFYDGARRKTAIVTEDTKVCYFYNELGQESQVHTYTSDTDYLVNLKKYDYLNRVVEERQEDPYGKIFSRITYAYNAQNEMTQKEVWINEHESSLLRIEYNTQQMATKIIDPDGNETIAFYNHSGIAPSGKRCLEVTRIDALGKKELEYLDRKGNLIYKEVYSPWGELLQKTEFFFDAFANCTCERHYRIHKEKEESIYEIYRVYDEHNHLLNETQRNGTKEQVTEFSYYPTGELRCIFKPDGVVIHHEYDSMSLLTRMYSTDLSIYYLYEYNKCDLPTKITNYLKKTHIFRTYTSSGKLAMEENSGGFRSYYSYDKAGRITKFKTFEKEASYEYEGPYLSSCHYKDKNEEYTHQITKNNWIGLPIKQKEFGNAGETCFHWDALGRRKSTEHSSWNEHIPQDGFDAIGNLCKISRNDVVGEEFRSFTYDSLYQIIEEHGEKNNQYSYDSLYNRRNKNDEEYEVDELNCLRKTASIELQYDDNGNICLKKDGDDITAYRYDALNRLREVRKNGEVVRYTYDYLHRREAKRVVGKPSLDRYYLYLDEIEIGSYNNLGIVEDFRIVSPGRSSLPETLLIFNQGDLYASLEDYQHNISCLIDIKSAEAKEFYRYSAFGEAQVFDTSGNEVKIDEALSPWLFSSKRYEKEIGMFYFGRRYYLPEEGRWLTQDPLGFSEGPNLYAYVRNRSLNFIDPQGLKGESSGFICSIKSSTMRFFTSIVTRLSDALSYMGETTGSIDKNGDYEVWINKMGLHTRNISPILSIIGEFSDPDNQLFYVCGILNSQSSCEASAKLVSNMCGDREVVSFFNRFSEKNDLKDFANFKHLVNVMNALTLAKNIQDYCYNNPNGRVLIIAHSQGCVATILALKMLEPLISERVTTALVASPIYTSPGEFKNCTHIAGNWDIITKIDIKGREECDGNLIEVQSGTCLPHKAHEFSNSAYQECLRGITESFFKKAV